MNTNKEISNDCHEGQDDENFFDHDHDHDLDHEADGCYLTGGCLTLGNEKMKVLIDNALKD